MEISRALPRFWQNASVLCWHDYTDDGWICKLNNHNDTCNEQIPGITKLYITRIRILICRLTSTSRWFPFSLKEQFYWQIHYDNAWPVGCNEAVVSFTILDTIISKVTTGTGIHSARVKSVEYLSCYLQARIHTYWSTYITTIYSIQ